jgi:AcrR family transcriptional regulator
LTIMVDRPLRADARRNRERVLAAAREAFAEAGVGVPLDEIAARAGVGAGTVYRHFSTKEALFEAVVVTRMQDLIAEAQYRVQDEDSGAAFFGLLARIGDEAAVKRDVSDALSGAGGDPAGLLAGLRDELNTALGALLARAQRAGAVRADISVDDLVALLKGLLATVQASDDPGLRARVRAVLCDGLRPPRYGSSDGGTGLSSVPFD